MRQGRPREGENLGGFVRGIARHVIADMLRARQRTTRLEAVSETAGAAPGDALSVLISAEERDRVRRALTQLSAGDQEILHLCFFEGFSPAEIAERVDEPAPRPGISGGGSIVGRPSLLLGSSGYLFNVPAEDALVVVPAIHVPWRFTAQVCMNDPIPVTREEIVRSTVTHELIQLGPNAPIK